MQALPICSIFIIEKYGAEHHKSEGLFFKSFEAQFWNDPHGLDYLCIAFYSLHGQIDFLLIATVLESY